MPVPARFVGITVMPEFIQAEGIDRVISNLVEKAGATAVATSPNVVAEADAKTGSREPPIDAGAGKVRLLDRALWGKRELFVRSEPSFEPHRSLYAGLRYQPPAPGELTRRHGRIVADFVAAAKRAGLKVYFQVQAASPPGYRVQFGGPLKDDAPLLPDGRVPPRRVANNASLASPHVRAYNRALVRDLLRAYPSIDGIRVDWPEYPPYFFDDAFLDFSVPAQAAAERLGLDFDGMRREAGDLYEHSNKRLNQNDLEPWLEGDGGRYALARTLTARPKLGDWLRFKATLSSELLTSFRAALTEGGGLDKELMPNAFPPPFSLISGLDYTRAGAVSAALSVKLYTMHWPMMLRFWGEQIAKGNPKLPERLLVRALARFFDISDDGGFERLADYRYPEPGEAHPVGAEAQARKIRQAQSEAGACPVIALAHGYGPAGDFRQRLQTAFRAARGRVWINRYGYLSDEKLGIVGRVCRVLPV